ncbi:MAG: hypothetical protein SFZ23_08110 [Planctomycetota bacterium]|nr:hypothetical protein [Planctomycetota bacterium]
MKIRLWHRGVDAWLFDKAEREWVRAKHVTDAAAARAIVDSLLADWTLHARVKGWLHAKGLVASGMDAPEVVAPKLVRAIQQGELRFLELAVERMALAPSGSPPPEVEAAPPPPARGGPAARPPEPVVGDEQAQALEEAALAGAALCEECAS